MDASCHYAYERKHVALHGTGRYDEAIEAFDNMLSLIEHSGDPEIRSKSTGIYVYIRAA